MDEEDPAETVGTRVAPAPLDPDAVATPGPPTDTPGPATHAPGPATHAPERPVIERVGLAAIALLLVAVFAALGYAAVESGEVFLGVMAWIGALMTFWAAASTLRRG